MYIIPVVGILIVLALLFTRLPIWLKLIILTANSFFPDPIPVVDEVLMVASVIGDILRIAKAQEFIRRHRILSIVIGCALLGLIIFIIASLF